MRALRIARLLVFATHWIEQSLPYGAPQDARLRKPTVVKEEGGVAPDSRGGPQTLESHVSSR